MSTDLNRRRFLITGSVLTGGLLVGCSAPVPLSRLGDREVFRPTGDQVALNGWVKITTTGQVIVASPRSEMGQGIYTALATLVADELDADWDTVSVEQAPIAKIYANTAMLLNASPFLPDDEGYTAQLARSSLQRMGYVLSLQATGGSSSVRDAWEPMRLAGATARAMLVQAAAQRWSVPAEECSVANSVVSHLASGKKAGFGELVKAAAEVSPPQDVKLKSPADFRLIGKSVRRTDIPDKTNGRAIFGIDVRVPGMLYAAIRHCPVFGGTVKSFDASAIGTTRGVKHILQIGRSAVVVVADNTWRARTALDKVNITWDEGPNAQLSSSDISAQLRRDLDTASSSGFRDVGNAAKVIEQATRLVEAVYEVPFLAHAAMEPINCAAQVKDGKVTVWNSTQVPSFARQRAAKVAGVDAEKVTLHVPFLGGGFGRRLEFDMVEEAVAIAMHTGGQPVKLTWSREEDMQHDMYRPAAVSRFIVALDPKGRPHGWINRVSAPSIGLAAMERLMPAMAVSVPDKNQIEGAFELPYEVPHIHVSQIRSKTPVPIGFWRSVGHSYNAFFTECFLDEVAHAAGKDPYEYRRTLLKTHPRHKAVLELAATKAGWGVALPAGRARGIALHESFGSICAQVAEISLVDGVPRVHRVVCALDCGSVVNPDTIEAQMQSSVVFGLSAALFGEITVKEGRTEQSNYSNYDVIKLANMPAVETHIVPSEAPPGGVGEPGTPPIAPAVANALFSLTRKRVRKLPLTANNIEQAETVSATTAKRGD
jgi:isoquinoline 1-oxidoreductase beta subunit